jgi:hypothetical protein
MHCTAWQCKRLEFKVLSKKCAVKEEFDDWGKDVRESKQDTVPGTELRCCSILARGQ